jgi:hypothetical protein
MAQKQTITFTKEKDTKNTVKFQEDAVEGQAPAIGTLYVQKWFVGAATKVRIDIEAIK